MWYSFKEGKEKKKAESLKYCQKYNLAFLSHLLDKIDWQQLCDATGIVGLEGENQKIQCSCS